MKGIYLAQGTKVGGGPGDSLDSYISSLKTHSKFPAAVRLLFFILKQYFRRQIVSHERLKVMTNCAQGFWRDKL